MHIEQLPNGRARSDGRLASERDRGPHALNLVRQLEGVSPDLELDIPVRAYLAAM
jgi:hypothetical protein